MSFIMPARTVSAAGTEPKRMFHGVYRASVVNTNDPKRANRVTLNVPQVLGSAVSNWADPIGVPYPQTVGTIVYAMFSGGDINKPVYFTSIVSTWAQLTPLGTGWTAGSGVAGVFYRLLLTGDVMLAWDIQTSTSSNANTIATLPSGYRPATTVQLQSGWLGGGPTSYSVTFGPSVKVATSGAITAQGIPSLSGSIELFGTTIIPMGVL